MKMKRVPGMNMTVVMHLEYWLIRRTSKLDYFVIDLIEMQGNHLHVTFTVSDIS